MGEISWNFQENTLEISHNTCTTPNEPECKRPRWTGASVGRQEPRFDRLALTPFILHHEGLCTLPLTPPTYEFKWNFWSIIKIKLKVSSGSVLLYDWLAYLFFFAEPELVNHILGNPWLLRCWLVRYGLMEESLLYLLMCLGNFYQKENLHSFTTPRVYPTKAICWSSWYKSYTHVPCCCIELHQTLWPSEMSSVLAWSRSLALHQLNFYTRS